MKLRSPLRSPVRPVLRSPLEAGSGGLSTAFQAALSDARIAVFMPDAAAYSGKYAPNRVNTAQPSDNIIAFPTGPIMNATGSATLPVRTPYHTTWADSHGTSWATRLTATADTSIFYLYRPSIGPGLPAGQYTMEFRMRSMPTFGSLALTRYGPTSSYSTGTVQELDWTQAANEAGTTFSVTFTYNGTDDIAIRPPAVTNATDHIWDVLLDRVRLYSGANVPAWEVEAVRLEGFRKAWAYPNSIRLDANNAWDLQAGDAGGWLLEPALANHPYTAMTQMDISSVSTIDATDSNSYALAIPTDPTNATALGLLTPNIGYYENLADRQGKMKMNPPSDVFNKLSGAPVDRVGAVIMGQTFGASGRRHYFDRAMVYEDATAWAGLSTNRHHAGSGTTAQSPHQTIGEQVGKHVLKAIWDRVLTPTEWAAKVTAIQAYLRSRGLLADIQDFHILSGDSNWTSGDAEFTGIIARKDFHSPAKNLLLANFAEGGTGIGETWGTNKLTIDPLGRFMAYELPALTHLANAGIKVAYWNGVGTNDFNEIYGVPAWGEAQYLANRLTIANLVLAAHPTNTFVFDFTIIAAGSGSGRDYTPSGRLTVNQGIRDYISSPRHVLCDLGGTGCDLGDQAIADLSTHLVEVAPGGIHLRNAVSAPSGIGDDIAAAYIASQLPTLRAAMGL